MTYSVYQHWDPLKVCVVGRSYPPEFYSWITVPHVRQLFERIATETEEDFQFLEKTLQSLGVKVIRPNTPNTLVDQYLTQNQRIPGPVSMNPRDQMIMVGDTFFVYPYDNISVKVSGRSIPIAGWDKNVYERIKGCDWPTKFSSFELMPDWVQQEVKTIHKEVKFNNRGEDLSEIAEKTSLFNWWDPVFNEVEAAGNKIISNFDDTNLNLIPANGITRVGQDLYFGCDNNADKLSTNIAKAYFSDYRCHFVTTGGHIDGCFTPVKPGLIVSIQDIQTYANTFPDWEVVYLKGESWSKVQGFLDLKKKNQGKWWIKGFEHDSDVINFVETWLRDWTGYVEESVFDVNILVVNETNIVVNGYNKQAFDAFKRHNITPHICPIRHRYFWDGGVHCVTLDLHRDGQKKDFFPRRS